MFALRSLPVIALTLSLIILSIACGGESDTNSAVINTPAVFPSPTPEMVIVSTAAPSDPITKVETTPELEIPSGFGDELFLQITDPVEVELLSTEPLITIVGRTRADAVVTLNDLLVEPSAMGEFEAELRLLEGPNVIEILASVGSGKYVSEILTVIYLPQN